MKAGKESIEFKTMTPEIGPRVVTIRFTRVGDGSIEIMGENRQVGIGEMVNEACPRWSPSSGSMPMA